MILFRVDITDTSNAGENAGSATFARSLREARAWTMAYLKGPADDSVTATISRCATSPALHGARLVLAALNGRGWMSKDSLKEIERWANLNGTPQTLPKTLPQKAKENRDG